MAGWHLHHDRHRQGCSGNSVAISTEVQGIVDSVDLSASPPLLSIGGQSYTTDKIKRVVRYRLQLALTARIA